MIRMILALCAALLAFPLQANGLEVRGNRLFLSVEVGDTRVDALLDSGAEMTIFDTRLAEDLGLASGAAVEARGTGARAVSAALVDDVSITALDRKLTMPKAAVIDLSDVGARLLGAPLPMILGRDFFDSGRVLIDIEGSRIAWLDDDAEPDGVMLDLTSAHGIETIMVGFGAAGAQSADFDLGNGSELLISSALASRLALAPVAAAEGGGIGGAVTRPVVCVPELTIAGVTFRDVRAHVTQNARMSANIGVSLLRRFVIVTDFPQNRIWLRPR